MSRAASWTFVLIWSWVSILSLTPAGAQDEFGPPPIVPDPVLENPQAAPAADVPPGRLIEVEKAYYVPFEKFDQVFERTGRGIFLPYEEFLELWDAKHGTSDEPDAAPPTDVVLRGGSYLGGISGELANFQVTYQIESLVDDWTEVTLPLQGVAVEFAELSDPEALFVNSGRSYQVYLPKKGSYQLRLRFAVRVTKSPGKKKLSFGIPALAISRLDLTIPETDVRVDVKPILAATQVMSGDAATQVLAFLGNSNQVTVEWSPPPGRSGEDGALVSARQRIVTQLGERTLRVVTEIDYQVLRGEVDTFQVRVPANMGILEVEGENLREWREGDNGVLTASLHAPIQDRYRLNISFERILAETPPTLEVPFPQVQGVLREHGWVIFSNDDELIVRATNQRGLSQVDPQEVPEDLRGLLGLGFRYLAHPLALTVSIEKITPEVRAATTSVITLSREEDQWLGWIDYTILRAGLFRLAFQVPEGWQVDTVGDASQVEDFQTTTENGLTTVTVSMKSKVSGEFRLPFRLLREGTARAGDLTLAPPRVVGVSQDRGLFGVSAPRSLEVVTGSLSDMLNADVDALIRSGIMGQVSADAGIPRAYRYLKQPASVALQLTEKRTEIDVLAQHLVEVADGEVRVTHLLDYNVLYAPVSSLRFQAPTALDERLQVEAKHKTQVRKTGTEGDQSIWEVSLQPPALGAVTITLLHTSELEAFQAGAPRVEMIPLVRAVGVRAEQGFVAIRKEGRLEILPEAESMEAIDVADLPDKLRRGQIYSSFRYFVGTPTLSLQLTSYEYQQLATTVIDLLHMKCVLSEERRLKVKTTLLVQNTERQYLEVDDLAPENILSLSVNGAAQAPKKRKQGSGILLEIPRSYGRPFPIVLVYDEPLADSDMGSFGFAGLQALAILGDVPVSKTEVELHLPRGYTYSGWSGSLHRRSTATAGLWGQFKGMLSVDTPAAAKASRGPSRQLPTEQGIQIDIPTEEYELYRFDTLAPRGELQFFYMGWKLFWFLDFLAFVVALVATYLLLTQWVQAPVRAASIVLFVTLMLSWFATGPLGSMFTSVFLGVIAVCGFFGVRDLSQRVVKLRRERLALEPDPFLEEVDLPPIVIPQGDETSPPASDSAEPAAEGEANAQADSLAATDTEKPAKGKGKKAKDGKKKDKKSEEGQG